MERRARDVRGPPAHRSSSEMVETGAATGDARLEPGYGIVVQFEGCGWSTRIAESAVPRGSR